MTHKTRPEADKQVQGFGIGQMPLASRYPAFQMKRIRTAVQHLPVVIGFEKGRMTFTEMAGQLIANLAQVGKYADTNLVAFHNKAMRIGGIVVLGKGRNPEPAYRYRFSGPEGMAILVGQLQARMAQRAGGNVYRQAVFAAQYFQPADMIAMLVGDKHRLYPGGIEAAVFHPAFCFPAGEACINQDGLPVVAYIIAVAIAARIQ